MDKNIYDENYEFTQEDIETIASMMAELDESEYDKKFIERLKKNKTFIGLVRKQAKEELLRKIFSAD